MFGYYFGKKKKHFIFPNLDSTRQKKNNIHQFENGQNQISHPYIIFQEKKRCSGKKKKIFAHVIIIYQFEVGIIKFPKHTYIQNDNNNNNKNANFIPPLSQRFTHFYGSYKGHRRIYKNNLQLSKCFFGVDVCVMCECRTFYIMFVFTYTKKTSMSLMFDVFCNNEKAIISIMIEKRI